VEEITAGPVPHRWTEETMFDQSFRGEKLGIRRYTNEFRAARDKETEWVPMEARPSLSRAQGRAIGVDEQTCLLCDDNRSVPLMHRGTVTGIEMRHKVECHCVFLRRCWRDLKRVDRRFFDVTLDTIEPSQKVNTSLERQAEIIEKVKAHSGDSHLLIGPPGGGKTHLMAALYQNAVVESVVEQRKANMMTEAVWWASTSVLLNEHVTKETEKEQGDAPEPYVTERKIRNAAKFGGWRPRLFLDEIDKIAVSDFKIRRLGELVNAVYAASGQVVATMNKSPDALAAKWKDEDEAGTILRRIGSDGGHIIHVG
jgi:predicted ATPase